MLHCSAHGGITYTCDRCTVSVNVLVKCNIFININHVWSWIHPCNVSSSLIIGLLQSVDCILIWLHTSLLAQASLPITGYFRRNALSLVSSVDWVQNKTDFPYSEFLLFLSFFSPSSALNAVFFLTWPSCSGPSRFLSLVCFYLIHSWFILVLDYMVKLFFSWFTSVLVLCSVLLCLVLWCYMSVYVFFINYMFYG